MADAAPRHFDLDAVRCVYCGAELDAAQAAETGRCPQCERGLVSPGRNPAALRELLKELEPEAPRLRSSQRTQQALAELISAGPKFETPKMVEEVIAVEKRGGSFLAFVPFVGAWLIQRSEQHTPAEKQRLSLVSLGLGLAILLVVWALLPTEADRLAELRARVDSEMAVLCGLADRYRAEHGAYPDEDTWKRFAERADGRFFDPWARPYRYEPRADGITIETLGRDARPGGKDEDADASVEHSAPAPAAATD